MAKKDEMHEWIFKNNPRNKEGRTLLHWAAKHGHLDIYKSIIEEVKDKNPKETQLYIDCFVANFRNGEP